MVEDTKRKVSDQESEELYIASYNYLIENKNINTTIKNWAMEAITFLENETLNPFVILQHGDLWQGNVMIDHTNIFKNKFKIIDWGGAKENGFPYSDLIYYCMKFRLFH